MNFSSSANLSGIHTHMTAHAAPKVAEIIILDILAENLKIQSVISSTHRFATKFIPNRTSAYITVPVITSLFCEAKSESLQGEGISPPCFACFLVTGEIIYDRVCKICQNKRDALKKATS